VSVLGQVNRPGRYPVEGKRKVLDLLALAGGINPEGGDTISLVRKRNNQHHPRNHRRGRDGAQGRPEP
jgi:polysaccharide export outer membrane protein